MSNKDYLGEYRVAVKKIRELELRKEEIAAQQERVTQSYSAMPKDDGEDYQTKQARLLDKLQTINDELYAMVRLKDNDFNIIDEAIACLKHEDERTVMRLRYLENWKWEAIADKLGYSEVRQAFRVHGRALLNIHFSENF